MKLFATLFVLASLAHSSQARIKDLKKELEDASRSSHKEGNLRQKKRRHLKDDFDYTGGIGTLTIYDDTDLLVGSSSIAGTGVAGSVRSDNADANSEIVYHTVTNQVEFVDQTRQEPVGQCLQEFDYDRRRRRLGGSKKKYGGHVRTAACNVDDDDQKWLHVPVPGTSSHIYMLLNMNTNDILYYDADEDFGLATWPAPKTDTADHEDTWLKIDDPRDFLDLIDCDEDSLSSDEEDECRRRRNRRH